MEFLPLAWRLVDQPVLLVGAGNVAHRKAELLLRAGAHLRLVAPAIDSRFEALAAQHKIEIIRRRFAPNDIENCILVVAATNDPTVQQQVYEAAVAARIPVNAVDKPQFSTVAFPAIVDRSPLIISVFSGGKAPVFSRWVRSRIETFIPAKLGKLVAAASEFRARIAEKMPVIADRRIFWESLLEGEFLEKALNANEAGLPELIESALDNHQVATGGEVFLVGAGPGDPELLTFKALRLLQKADVVLYDRLVAPAIVDLARRDADKIYVGKARSDHVLPQEEINRLLVQLAQEGKKVCRLKGGDPFIFGRGGEELEQVIAAGIPFQVVPGITAASGCASYAGIPLTHRDHAQSVRFVTGHRRDNTVDLPWPELINPQETLVFYMGLLGLPEITRQLIDHGLAANTPAALVSKGTLPEQQVIVGTLENLALKVEKKNPAAPSLIIVGSVVTLRAQLDWYEAETV